MSKINQAKTTITGILRNNKGVDPKELEAIRALRRERRKLGRGRASYNLALPFERRKVTIGVRPEADPRAVQLRSSLSQQCNDILDLP